MFMPIESSRLRGGGNGCLGRTPRDGQKRCRSRLVSGVARRMKGWRFVWFWILATTFFLAVCCSPSLAQPMDDSAEVGHGLVCDTAKHWERFLFSLMRAMIHCRLSTTSIVRAKARLLAASSSLRSSVGNLIEHGTIRGHSVSIVKVTVVAVDTGSEWKKVPATTQYAIFGEKDLAL